MQEPVLADPLLLDHDAVHHRDLARGPAEDKAATRSQTHSASPNEMPWSPGTEFCGKISAPVPPIADAGLRSSPRARMGDTPIEVVEQRDALLSACRRRRGSAP